MVLFLPWCLFFVFKRRRGIADTRLTTKGFGATKPVDKNDSAEGKANNRRVEFVKI